ncbi:hypothetical protein BpHYR1_042781 [Brachionus plicatilis]|uniref:Transmembrane protein n=1 Tax=Brachionus plicatilis TaxID=10195 RepID=A0A3M7Q8L4_BRAPC|nr:hypothetical protein BpHYR1_042781 [Brachionus plicatilis]
MFLSKGAKILIILFIHFVQFQFQVNKDQIDSLNVANFSIDRLITKLLYQSYFQLQCVLYFVSFRVPDQVFIQILYFEIYK